MDKAVTLHSPRDRPLVLRELLDELVQDGLVAAEQARELQLQTGSRVRESKHPLAVIADAGWVHASTPARKLTLEYLVQWYAGRVGLPYYRIDPLSIDVARITSVMAYPYAARLGILPVKVSDSDVVIATSQPFQRAWERELEPIIRRRIKRVFANPEDIERYLVEFYTLARSVKASVEQGQGELPGALRNLEQLIELGRAGKLDAKDHHVISIVDWLLQFAFDQRASDIHLEPRRDLSHIRFRIDGVLHEVYQMPAQVMAAVTSRIKILARMDLAEKRRPQDGRIKTRNPDGREIELRASSMPTAFGEKLVLRIFDPEVLVKDFSQLGFSPSDQRHWEGMIQQNEGIILVTGPTGSGKTTTLYSTLRQLATSQVNVVTIEDPIELVEPAFNQMQVQGSINLTFASGVRAMLRQDPDIIMIGEIRDLETADIAVQSALTGHLVLSTLHTNDAPSAITRLLNLGVPPYLIQATVLGVLAQRLVRTLCPHCKQPVEPDEKLWRELTSGFEVPKPKAVFEPVGCLECRATGYYGRAGIYEMMPLSLPVKSLITEDTNLARLRDTAYRQGTVPLRLAGVQKVAAGLTSVDEVLKSAPVPALV